MRADPPTDADFYNQVLLRGYWYLLNGVVPDIYTIDSWEHTTPTTTVPETTDYTFMNDAAVFRTAGWFPR